MLMQDMSAISIYDIEEAKVNRIGLGIEKRRALFICIGVDLGKIVTQGCIFSDGVGMAKWHCECLGG